jgi:hypothetical protein
MIKWNHETTSDYVLYDFDLQDMQKYIDGEIDMYSLLEKSTEIYVLDIDASKTGSEKYTIKDRITKHLWSKYFKNSYINNVTMKEPLEKLTSSIVDQKIDKLLKSKTLWNRLKNKF